MSPIRYHRVAAGNVKVELPEAFSRASELESGDVMLAAQWTPWPQLLGDLPRPRCTVTARRLTPAPATLEQFSVETVRGLADLGRHVVADFLPRQSPARGYVVLYDADGFLVVERHDLRIIGGRAVATVVRMNMSEFNVAGTILTRAVQSMTGSFGVGSVIADPDRTPASYPGHVGPGGEDISFLAAQPSLVGTNPPLSDAQWSALRGGPEPSPAEFEGLRELGLIGYFGGLRKRGKMVRRALDKPVGRARFEVTRDGTPGPAVLDVYRTDEVTVVCTDRGDGVTLDIVPPRLITLVLASWLGLWPWPATRREDPREWVFSVPPPALDARFAAPDAPCPAQASPSLQELWHLPWETTSATNPLDGHRYFRLLRTDKFGAWIDYPATSDEDPKLVPFAPISYLEMLIRLTSRSSSR